ncbi:valine--tRNA ligase [Lihuaxuella thermophila]|uniref:Valine--tRNA ligase n=1 Tax=Lihuaxuella thermophila TaxID=1173111 RepID=A0A1H8FQH8_9BACL|nr:valine--tRNA ligase [Lihuaxuella thermophila]SEN33919.1 valyl-tRNA synthetase [Lihuaxuella thermophila]
MAKEIQMPTKYDPKSVESKRYQFWLDNDLFKASEDQNSEPFCIVMPPPNVTGMLHMGHALDFTLQDILIRMKRMQGYDTLWLPGMDHAGIATQAKVEEKLRKEGINRHDLGREAFLEKTWAWKEHFASIIREQWSKMGFSIDYSRERFTMDEGLSRAVRKVFVDLYNKGLIYRGKYIINWDPVARTAISDIEVIYKEVKGALYHLRYPLSDGSGFIEVATTRPETMLGDTAVAVHPEDERYKDLIGKTITLPIAGREIPIIADDYVDPEFGSGAVKITPAHDPNDFEVGKRHNLPQILVMDESGKMNELASKYQGMDRFECRKQIIKDLEEAGYLIKIEEHVHSVGHSERSGAVVEPYLSTQWFVKMKPLAEKAIQLQKSEDKVRFVPERFEKLYVDWIENIRDWCISRQLWWGHRIPAWHCKNCGEITVSMEDPSSCSKCGSSNILQDEDVLDTWFSSALWPFSTMGWPEKTADLSRYYPNNVLVTGHDIIYPWVARMIFTALEFTGEKPFKDVIIHGLVRDAEGIKMSKSLGNGVDPLEVIDQYGADTMRFMISTGSTPGQDLRFRWERLESARNFINKIWNASRFVLMNLDDFGVNDIDLSGSLNTADQWILTRLQETINYVTHQLEEYHFNEAGKALYEFIWDEFCDWYIEFAKLSLYGDDSNAKKTTRSVLCYVLDRILRLLHPFMPFVTEEIWQNLPHEGKSIMIAKWPEFVERFQFPEAVEQMNLYMEVIRSVRNIRAEVNVPLSKKVNIFIRPDNEKTLNYMRRGEMWIRQQCNPENLIIGSDISISEKAMTAVVTGAEILLPLAGLIDIDQEVERLKKELKTLNAEVERVQKKLSNQEFINKAPAHVVEEERKKEKDYLEKREKVKARLAQLQS